MSGRPILVTGSHRSGTTWVGRMLCVSGQAGYIHEPFNPRRKPGWTGDAIPYWYLHVTPENERFYIAPVERLLGFGYPVLRNMRDITSARTAVTFGRDVYDSLRYRIRRPRPLLKDPIALFAAPWLAARFDAVVIVMIRNPLAFAGSIKKLGWSFRFRSWLAQPSLVAGPLAPYRADMVRLAAGGGDIVDQAIVMWNALHDVIDRYRTDHPEWAFMRHEDIARDPLGGFATLYDHAGLAHDEKTRDRIASYSSGPRDVPLWRHGTIRRDSDAATATWQSRLSDEEVERVKEATAEVASRFYAGDHFPNE